MCHYSKSLRINSIYSDGNPILIDSNMFNMEPIN